MTNGVPFKFEKRAQPRFALEREGFADVVNRRVNGEGHGLRLLTVNVGAGGMMVTLDGELSQGDVVRIVFPSRDASLAVGARVVWLRRNSVRLIGQYTAGLAFHPADQPDGARLAAQARSAAAGAAAGGVR